MKTFIPNQLNNENSFFAMGTISTVYWDFAKEMEQRATEQFKDNLYSIYVFPYIIFLCSTLEALLNENLTLLEKDNPSNKEYIQSLKDSPNREFSLRNKILNTAKLFNEKMQVDENVIINFIALSEIRNSIIHYTPNFSSIFEWPNKLREALNRSKVKVIPADWTITFRQKEIMIWAKDTTMDLIKIFLPLFKKNEKEFFGD